MADDGEHAAMNEDQVIKIVAFICVTLIVLMFIIASVLVSLLTGNCS